MGHGTKGRTMHVAGKIAIGVGLAGLAAVALTACAPKETDPQSLALDEFQPFDKNKDNQWTKQESTRFEIGRPYTGSTSERRIGDFVHWERQIVHKEFSHSMQKAFAAAQGNDAVASLQELTDLAKTFDTDGSGSLNRKEQRAFRNAYGATETSRTILDRTESGFRYDPYPDPVPNYPGNGPGDGGGYNPGNGPGDGGGYNPGNGSGDSGGYTPPSSGNGGGDSTPSKPSRPDNGGGSKPPANDGNSTDNGNPNYDDF
ncbi:MAG: hypothetical protein ABI200_07210 [Gaiellales bacterium]